MTTEIVKSFKYRLYPSAAQVCALEYQLEEAARLYNAALQERRDAWRLQRRSVSFYEQSKQLKEIRAAGDTGIASYKIAEDVLHRVREAFQHFFRRVKSGQRPGYPRFRSAARYDSLSARTPDNGIKLRDGGVFVRGVEGAIKCRQHRAITGTVKTASVKREGQRWFVVVVSREIGAFQQVVPSTSVGLDVGLSSFVATSEGETVPAPKFFRSEQRALRKDQRRLARSKHGGARRRKAAMVVAERHRRVRRRRADFTHKLSRTLVDRYDRIAVEDLNIKGLARTRLAKSIHDAGWRLFLNQLRYKAAWAGKQLVEVDPAGTSQTCVCGAAVPKTLKDRWHLCTSCGLDAPRDVVSAQIIEARGRRVQALTRPIGSVVCGGVS